MACFSRSYAGNLPSSFSTLRSSALVFSTSPPVSVSGTVYVGAISWDTFAAGRNPIIPDNIRHPSLTHWPTNINVVPIDYGFRPRLRGRLTLLRLTLSRNPWTFGGSVSHTPVVTHVCIRTSDTSRTPHGYPFTGLRNAPLPLIAEPASSVHSLSPDTFSAQKPLFRPVSCYAFFKGWLLLSQPPGCFRILTSFHT